MKQWLTVFICLFALGLVACSAGHDSQQTESKTSDHQQKTVFSGYVHDVDKAKQVQKKVDAAHKKLKAAVERAEK